MILTGEVSEFVSNRQHSKIQFLQEENNQLREYIRDLESQAKLNKEALKISLGNYEKISKNQSQSTYTSYCIEDHQVFQYQQLVEKLNEENQRLLSSMQKLAKEK